ncbi:MAG: alpha/beta hydrolase [Bacteroidetes bacterium]|nr:MAG: alpha/beta hydrolase [Bacteroidota bacterium]
MNFIITNREVYKDPQSGKDTIRNEGHEHASDNLRFGEYDATNDFTLYDDTQLPNDDLYANLASEELVGSAKFFKELYKAIQDSLKTNKKSDVLFFVHGFNTDLHDVRKTFKDLEKCYITEGSPIKHIVVFSWPSRSPEMLIPAPWYTYRSDKQDAFRSGYALSRAMEKLNFFYHKFFSIKGNGELLYPFCGQKIHLMVHSMGHQVLAKAIEEYPDSVQELFGEILLIAGDIEYKAFEGERLLSQLIDWGERIHIYYNRQDYILDASKITKNWNNRLGRYGRKNTDDGLADVHDVDVTKISDKLGDKIEKSLNHWYYYSSSEVVEDIIRVLKGGKSSFPVSPKYSND